VIVYGLVGLAAVYSIAALPAIRRSTGGHKAATAAR
jgi:uncharacterized membrane protein YuzA (DUF378 family)